MAVTRDDIFWHVGGMLLGIVAIIGIIIGGSAMLYSINLLLNQLITCHVTKCTNVSSDVLVFIIIPYAFVDIAAILYSLNIIRDILGIYIDSRLSMSVDYAKTFGKYPMLFVLILWFTLVIVYTSIAHFDIKSDELINTAILYYHLVVSIVFLVIMCGTLVYAIYTLITSTNNRINEMLYYEVETEGSDDMIG